MMNHTAQPKYLATYRAMKDRFASLPVGSAIPPESQLCLEYDVSRITIRKSVEMLADEGLLVKQQGRGTFTAQPTLDFKYRESFVDAIRGYHTDLTGRGFRVDTTVVVQELHSATAELAGELQLSPGSRLAYLRRLRTVDGTINHVSDSYLPANRFPDLVDTDFSDASLYEHLRTVGGVQLAASRMVVEVGFADTQLAQLLQVAEGAPLLVVRATVRDADDVPVVYGTSWLLPHASQVEFGVRVPEAVT